MNTNNEYTVAEEVIHTCTHGIGVALGITALVVLTYFSAIQSDTWKIVSSAIFGSSFIILYLSSTLYHGIPHPKLKAIFKTLDHSTIYLLIAGTYTPICLVSLRGGWGWSLFGITWGIALAGMLMKIFWAERFEKFSLVSYLLLGWIALVAIVPIYHHLAFKGFMWILAGGLCYSIGTIFYAWENTKYMHSIWHLFVIAGTVCHFFAILYYIIGV